MTDTLLGLRRKIASARDLASVVHTMKALAASGIHQYQEAVAALEPYLDTVELGLVACLQPLPNAAILPQAATGEQLLIIIGSDQGLVGQFNEALATFVANAVQHQSQPTRLITVGERIYDQLQDMNLRPIRHYPVPASVTSITELCQTLLLDTPLLQLTAQPPGLVLYYNRPYQSTRYRPHRQTVLPISQAWQDHLQLRHWPTNNLPELYGSAETTLRSLLQEYLFASLFRACAESLASEHSSRLAAMQRAETNINEQLDLLQHHYHRRRQDSIDAELFDVLYGFESLE
ncbi:MAG: F0F1 ATP synthase subunit gamma [Desulfuromonas sp.]|nr:F0F1 ATP synthase subunit gamma [Desulfuromonas sp.]